VTGPRIGSVCTGYRGLDTAVEAVFGGETVWHADIDPGASAILAHHWPTVPNLGDISAVNWDQVQQVDILTAGFPCQDVSLAGKRAGLTEGTRSGLWLQVARAIRELQPRLVVIENVRGLLSADAHGDVEPCPWCMGDAGGEPVLRALGAVLADLAGLGFDAEWQVVRASDVGAPHQRERAFVIAWPAADTACLGRGEGWPEPARLERRPGAALGGRSAPAHAASGSDEDGPVGDPAVQLVAEPGSGRGTHAGTPAEGAHRPVRSASVLAWGQFEPAIRRWETVLGRPAPAAVDARNRLSPAFVEWLMGLPAGHVTAVPGLGRTAQLKALGNGVVPQQAEAAIRLLVARAGLTAPAIPAA